MSGLTTIQKYKIVLEEFQSKKTLDSYDVGLLDRLSISNKQLGRILEDTCGAFDSIESFKEGKKTAYKLIKPIDIFTEAFDNSEEVGWIFQLAHEGDKSIFNDLKKYAKKSQELYMFKNSPFEDISNVESKEHFKRLKNIIKARDYAKLTFMYDDKVYDNLKCLKLVFIDNNWYIAYIDMENKLSFGRVSFIKRVDFASKSGCFQPSSVIKHLSFLQNSVQNSLTLYEVENKKAQLKATPMIAKYFKKDMKKFLSSQKFIKELEDGSIIFEVSYTQELEILPFVQKWLPDIEILEPQELRIAYAKKLEEGFKKHNS
jgi:hypothetical protein